MIEVAIEDDAWVVVLPDAEALAMAAAVAALAQVGGESGEVAILLADDAAIRALNGRFRGQDKPTNVLSFPAGPGADGLAGDIILAYGTCAAEAAAQAKPLADHLRHLVVHGVLHLHGHDHGDDAEAVAMETLERRILQGLGVPDPYAAEPGAKADHV
ncbi:MAG TPA: rRNA maturation RNase YbeY [Caulobacteraceae bacterium]|nr:rRNA maturation RNase YbeY [Caulobacteraceae bacterium]